MKKYYIASLILAIAGVLAAACLLYLNFSPAASGILSCSPVTPCGKTAAAGLGQFWGIPAMAFPLAILLTVLFTLLMADYARGVYYGFSAAVVFLLSSLLVIAHGVYFTALVLHRIFCPMQLALFVVILLLSAASFLWVRLEKGALSPVKWFAGVFAPGDNCDKKAAVYLYMMFALAFIFFILSSMALANVKTGKSSGAGVSDINQIPELKNLKKEDIEFPESQMVIGTKDAKVVIHLYNDFLCSACRSFSETEQQLVQKYGVLIRIEYHHFPLDASCNPAKNTSLYKNSCQASYIAQAAGENGVFESFVKEHFTYVSKRDHKTVYDPSAELQELERRGVKKTALLADALASKAIRDKVKSDAVFAAKNGIKATPTMFINGKRIEGAYPIDIMSQLIDRELENNN